VIQSEPKLAPARTLFIVALFAAAMAWVEAAVVYYLRTMIDRIDPYQAMPLPLIGNLGSAELVREAATMIMLVAVGWLAGTSLRNRMAYAVAAFGLWDILYYVFLKVMCDWPASPLDWDLLFLIPLPWWGPVVAPVSIAALMIAWGVLVVLSPNEAALRTPAAAWAGCFAGILLALYVFMADAIRIAGQGTDALRRLLPEAFNWPLFLVALTLMSLPVMVLARNRFAGTMWSNEQVQA